MSNNLLAEITTDFAPNGQPIDTSGLTIDGEGDMASWFRVTDLAAATVGLAGLELAGFAAAAAGGPRPAVRVDRRLASLWFAKSLQPLGWQVAPPWDAVAGDYRTSDGWIRLHTNAPHHRAAALSVLGCEADRNVVAATVADWQAEALEAAVAAAGGCAAQMRDIATWQRHDQGAAVAAQPLVTWQSHDSVVPAGRNIDPARPLAGIRVLDLTRVLAGPASTRFLAAYGADVLRIDPPHWNEPAIVGEMTLGKRCAGLDLTRADDRATLSALLAGADILVHGYRPGALAGLGFDGATLRRINPALIDVALDAYGWTGPWAARRGFDSLVQMSSGIADYGMRQAGAEAPVPLPVQAVDHATGYLMAATALHALTLRHRHGAVYSARLSLARTAHLLITSARDQPGAGLAELDEGDLAEGRELTCWGPARRLRFALDIAAIPARWDAPAGELRSAPATWAGG